MRDRLLGILIPPSVLVVIYGLIAGLSVGKLFLGCVVPGLLLSLFYVSYIAVRCFIRPQDGPPMPREERQMPLRSKLFLLLTSILPPAFLMFAVLGSIFFGVAAVTEAAAVGVIASITLAAIHGRLTFTVVKDACLQTLQITSMILLIAVTASFFAAVFVAFGGDEVISRLFVGVQFGKSGFLFIVMALLIVIGMFIDWIGIVFIVVPLITPVAEAFGFDPIWFAVLVMVNLQISFLTPPFAYSIFYLRGIAPPEVQTSDIYRGVVPFVCLQVVVVILCIVFPNMITHLPALMRN